MIFSLNKKEEAGDTNAASEPKQVTAKSDSDPRIIGICGDLDEEKAGDLMYGMLSLLEDGKTYTVKNPESETPEVSVSCEPFEFIISTLGGSAQEMFGIHDLMRTIREQCDISTVGLGKVFSAGTLLLASGTNGRRKIGRNCRVMVHSDIGGNHGPIHNLENEMEEIRWIQDRYIEAMVSETNMSKTHLKKILDRKVNAYFTAEEAVELGIADIIF